jgi:hypothetical protein
MNGELDVSAVTGGGLKPLGSPESSWKTRRVFALPTNGFVRS